MKLPYQIKDDISEKELCQDYIDLYKAVKTYFNFIYRGHPTNIEDIISNVVGKPRFQLNLYSYNKNAFNIEDWTNWDRTIQIYWEDSSLSIFECEEFEYDYEKVSKQLEHWENKLKEIEDIENSFGNKVSNLINKIKEINYV